MTPEPHTSARPPARRILVYLGLLVALGPLTVDLYLPAFPALQSDLEAPAAAVQLTLTATTVGLALGQLAVGPLSDTYGRRRPLLVATCVHVVASIGVTLSPTIGWVLVFRVLQGAGAAGGAVVAFAIVRDLFSGPLLVRALARLALVTGGTPVIAPFFGAQMLRVVDWRGIFLMVAGYGALVLVLQYWRLPETLGADRRATGATGRTLDRYRAVLRDRSFVGVALIGGLMVSGVFATMSATSFILQGTYGVDPQTYSLVVAATAVAFVAGTQIAGRLLLHRDPRQHLLGTLVLLTASGLLMAAASVVELGLPGLIATACLFFLSAGLTAPALSVSALTRHGERAGTAAALLGAANFGMAGLASPVVGALGLETAAPLGLVLATAGAIALLSRWALVR